MPRSEPPPPGNDNVLQDRWLAAGVAAVGLFFLVFAFWIQPTGPISPGDPGPRMFPVALSLLLLLGSVWLAVAPSFAVRPAGRETLGPPESQSTAEAEDTAGQRLVWLLLVGLVVMLMLFPLSGFSLTTLAGATLLLWRLGSSLRAAGLGALSLVVIVKLMFTHLFEVQLPEGYLDLWLG